MNQVRLYMVLAFGAIFLSGCASTSTISSQEVDLRPLACHWYDGSAEAHIDKRFGREASFAHHTAVYSVAAYNVYDDNPDRYEQIPFPTDEKWEVIQSTNSIQNNIGFAARAWTRSLSNGNIELVVAYRGTDDFTKDFYKGNLVFAKHLFGRTQFDAALEYLHEIKQRTSAISPTRTIVVGHSLGGGLAEYVQRLTPNSEAITFDTSPNQGRLYSLFEEKQARDAVRVYEHGEILSYLRFLLSPDLTRDASPVGQDVRTIWFDFYANNPLSAHSMRDLSASLIKVAAASDHAASKNILAQLCARPRGNAQKPLACNSTIQ
jgi:hypothetical protein